MRLLDVFMDTVAYVVYFRSLAQKHELAFEQVRERILGFIHEADKKAGEIPGEDYDLARFAIIAWIDETIMNSGWKGSQAWQREALQMRFYQTMNAGELFFERLNTLGVHQNQVREVYYMCLSLGFLGRYSKNEDRILLDQLKNSHLKVLIGNTAALADLGRIELFPKAYPAGEAHALKTRFGLKLNWMNAAMAALPAAILGVLFLVYNLVLGNVSQSLLGIMVP